MIQGIHFMAPCISCPLIFMVMIWERIIVTTERMGMIISIRLAASKSKWGTRERSMPRNIKLKSLMLAIWSALNTLENTSGEDLTALMMSF